MGEIDMYPETTWVNGREKPLRTPETYIDLFRPFPDNR